MAKTGKFEFDRNEKFLKGQELRRRILGPAYHDATAGMADDDPFLGPFRQLASEYCWGSVWSRPGLDEKTRRLINVALLTAGGRQHEVLTHVRAAAEQGGVTKDEIMEVILHTTVYAGIPAGVDAFRTAKRYFDAVEAGEDPGLPDV